MSAEENKPGALLTNDAVALDELEERREARGRKTWLVKAFTMTLIFMLVSSVLALLYAAVIQEKDLNTSFIGEMLKSTFEFLRFILG